MRLSPHNGRGQHGYVLMALLLAVTLVLIALSAGLPAISADLKRRREEELIHRGVQYTRAIQKYYRKYGRYPASLEQLEDNNHIRFLRKRYKDPITDSDFRLLHVGEVQLPAFDGLTNCVDTGNGSAPGVPLPVGSAPAPASPAGCSGDAAQSVSSVPFVSLDQVGATGTVFGGGPIIGVASTSDKQSFHIFANKDHYRDWQFVYSPVLERGGLVIHPFDVARDVAFGTVPGTPQPQSLAPIGDTPRTKRR